MEKGTQTEPTPLPTAPPTSLPMGRVNQTQSVQEIAPPTYYEAFQGLNPVQSKAPEPFIPRYEVVPVHLSRKPTYFVCPYCFKQTKTYTVSKYYKCTYIKACILGVISCILPLFLIPFFTDKPERIYHFCDECRQYIGVAYEDNPLLKDQVEEIRREEGN